MSYSFNFSATNVEAATLVGFIAGFGAYVVGHSPTLTAVYYGVLAGAGVLGYTGVSSTPTAP